MPLKKQFLFHVSFWTHIATLYSCWDQFCVRGWSNLSSGKRVADGMAGMRLKFAANPVKVKDWSLHRLAEFAMFVHGRFL